MGRWRPLTCVPASYPRTPCFGGLDRLTLEERGAGLAALPSGHAHVTAEQIVPTLPGAIVPPAPEVLIDDLPRGKVMRQQAPGTATAQDVEDRLQDFTRRICLGPPTGLGGGHQMADHVPFFIAQVGRVRFARVHAPKLPEVAHPRQPF